MDIGGVSISIDKTSVKRDVMFIQQTDNIYNFLNELNLNFNLYSSSGLDFVSNIYKNDDRKILFNLNLYYQWVNADYPPRINFIIEKNNIIYIKTPISLDDTLDMNYLGLNLIIDLKKNDKLRFVLQKQDGENNNIIILKNSNYNLKEL